MTQASFPSTRKRTILRPLFLLCGCMVVVALLTLATGPTNTSASAPTTSSAASEQRFAKPNADDAERTATGANGSLAPTTCQWTIATSPNPTQFSSLGGINALSASDIWAVGTYKTISPFSITNLTEHWDGSAWSIVPSPNVDPSGGPYNLNQLFSVDGIASNDVWAVGKVLYGAETLHWDGMQWNNVPLPDFDSIGDLRSVKMLSHNDVWAVSVIPASPTRAAIIHWDGVQWNIVYTSTDFTRPTGLYSLTVVSPTDMWAAGSIVMHYNGTQWSEVAGVMPIYTIYYAIHAISANDIWVVGGDGDQQNVTVHYDGTNWTLTTSPDPDTSGWLLGVGGLASNDVWAVGYSHPAGSSYGEGQAMHWNGSAWTSAVVQARDENGELDAIALLPSGEKWAVGYSNLHDGVTEHTLIERYTCDSATPTATSVGATATATLRPPTATRTPTHAHTATATPMSGSATPTSVATACTIQFVDVPPGSPFYQVVRCLACRNVLGGYTCGGPGEPCPGNFFRPNNNLSRGQIAKIVSQAAQFSEPIPETQQTFEDAPHGSTFWLWIEQLAGRGIIGGYTCGGHGEPCVAPNNRPYFRVNNSVTRGQAAKTVTIAAGITDPIPETQQTFEDAPHGSTFWLWIEQLAGRGIIGGYTCGGHGEPCVAPNNRPYFRVNNSVTRGQAAKIVSNTFFPNCLTP